MFYIEIYSNCYSKGIQSQFFSFTEKEFKPFLEEWKGLLAHSRGYRHHWLCLSQTFGPVEHAGLDSWIILVALTVFWFSTKIYLCYACSAIIFITSCLEHACLWMSGSSFISHHCNWFQNVVILQEKLRTEPIEIKMDHLYILNFTKNHCYCMIFLMKP